MKKMIKNLMLVAVAAMAFVGCQNDNDEMNATARKVVLNFVAGFDEDTRATFGDKVGEAYPTYWDGNENVEVTISGDGNNFRSIGSVELPEGEKTSLTAKISVEFDLEEDQTLPAAGTITATVGTNYNGEPYISTNQSPTEKSVESMSLIATREYTNGDITGEALVFEHAAAYGKMTLSQFNEDAADITNVKVTINDNQTIAITPNNGETKLTTPTIWFTTYGGDFETPIEVETMTIEAIVGGGVYTRTIDMTDPKITKPLKFTTGRVSAFEVTALTEKEPNFSYSFNKFVAIGETTGYYGNDPAHYAFRFTNDEYEEMVIAFHTTDVVDGQLPIGTFEIGEQLAEGSVFGNGSYFYNIIELKELGYTYPLYFGGGPGTVTIALEEGTYSVEVSMPSAYFVQADQYVKATCEYNPTAVTVEGRWYNYDTREFLLTFKVGGSTVLTIDGFSKESDAILSEGEYTVSAGYEQVAMNIIGGWSSPSLATGTMTITHLVDGYRIVINAVDSSDNAHSYTYEGPVISADKPFNPGDPTPLAAPENLEATVSGSTITLTWDAVTGAQDYTVSWNDGKNTKTVTSTECVVENLDPLSNYWFKVVANPSDTENNLSSKEAQVGATTGIDKSTAGDFNYTYNAYTELGSNRYKFYNSANAEQYLLLNFSDDIKTLEAGSYTYAVNDGIVSGAESAFNIPEHPNGTWVAHWIQEANIVYVDVAADNTFTITVFCNRFINGTYNSNALYKGVWTGKFAAPLATPTVTATVQNTNEIVVTWDAVANAASYTVSCPGQDDQVVNAASELTATFTGLSYNTEYTVSVVANPAGASYIKSEAGTATVKTGVGYDYEVAFTTMTYLGNGMYEFTDGNGVVMRLTFNTNKCEPLQAGTYVGTYDANNESADAFYVDCNMNAFYLGDGTSNYGNYTWFNGDASECIVNVSVDGAGNYSIVATAVVFNIVTYSGSVAVRATFEGKPASAGEAEPISLTSISKGSYNNSYYLYTYTLSDGNNNSMTLAVGENNAQEYSIKSGNYTWQASPAGLYNGMLFTITSLTIGGESVKSKISAGTMTVASEDDNYTITFDLTIDGNSQPINFTGVLAAPKYLTQPNITEKLSTASDTISIAWDAVANAESYHVTCGDKSQDVTTTTATFTGLTAGTQYTVTVVAKANGYVDSPAATTTVTTMAGAVVDPDPDPEPEATVVELSYVGYNGQYVFNGDDGRTYLFNFRSIKAGTYTYSLVDNTAFTVAGWKTKTGDYTTVGITNFNEGDELDLTVNGSTFKGSIVVRATIGGQKIIATCSSFDI